MCCEDFLIEVRCTDRQIISNVEHAPALRLSAPKNQRAVAQVIFADHGFAHLFILNATEAYQKVLLRRVRLLQRYPDNHRWW